MGFASTIPQLLFILALAQPTFAKEYTLFQPSGEFTADYDLAVRALTAGDVVRFSNGKSFHITEVLGSGGTTKVLAIDDGRALRIPLANRRVPDNTAHIRDYISSFLNGYAPLRDAGVPAVRVFTDESVNHEYVIVEKLKVQFTYDDLTRRNITADEIVVRQAWRELIEFGSSLWNFTAIGDWRPEQLGYTNRGWVLLDWTEQHERARYVEDGVLHFWGPVAIRQAVAARIRNIRKKHLFTRQTEWGCARLMGDQEPWLDAALD